MYSREYDLMLEIRVQHIVTTRVRPWRRQARLATRSGAQITNARRATVTMERGQTAGQRPAQDTVWSLEASQVAAHSFQQLESSCRWRGGGKRSSQRPSPRGAGGPHRMLPRRTRRTKQGRFIRILFHFIGSIPCAPDCRSFWLQALGGGSGASF